MEAYKTLVDDLDAQIEAGLALFENKWEKAMDNPLVKPDLKPVHEGAEIKPAEIKPAEINEQVVIPPESSGWFNKLSDLGRNLYTNLRSNAIEERVADATSLPTLTGEERNERISESSREDRSKKHDNVDNVLSQLHKYIKKKNGGTRRKRKGPTRNRTRIAGLSDKPLHQKNKKITPI